MDGAAASQPDPQTSRIYFGGPDQPARCLRALLEARVRATPAGEWIDWTTYYFRDRLLAQALIDAADRGVHVKLCIEGAPRRARANNQVIAMLKQHGLGGGLRVNGCAWHGTHPRLHAKLYAFSWPQPSVMIGSFNPSGDLPEDLDIIAEIGDQDRGHNLLVELSEPHLVAGIVRYGSRLWKTRSWLERFTRAQNQAIAGGLCEVYFYPRMRPAVIERALAAVPAGAAIRGAISHLKAGPFSHGLAAAARRGVDVRLVVHDTERRVPSRTMHGLAAAGAKISRYEHSKHLPMHAKFLLFDQPESPSCWFGSLNFNSRSRLLNHEILVRCCDPNLMTALSTRFDLLEAEVLNPTCPTGH